MTLPIYIHRLTYSTDDGTAWEYRTAAISGDELAKEVVRDAADRAAFDTDPALTFTEHTVLLPGIDDAPEVQDA